MRFMMIVKASPESEEGQMPTEQELREMGEYNEELASAGIMLSGEGLHPTSRGAKVRFEGDRTTVVDGPFTEAKELIAGFWMIEVGSRDEAIEWARKIPFREGEVELRQVFETDEFAESDPSGELRAQEHRLRERLEAKAPKP
jgi:hypothetical protein